MFDDVQKPYPWRRTLYIMSAAVFLSGSGMSLVLPFLPLHVQELGVSDPAEARRWAGYLASAMFICSALMAPVWGALGDRYGRKPMVMRAICGVAISISLMAFARTPMQLLILRMLQGATSGFIAASVALVASTAPRSQIGYALALMHTSVTAGTVIGPLMGGPLADWLGFDHVFLFTGGLAVIAGVIVGIFVQEDFTPSPPEERYGLRDNLRLLRTMPPLRTTVMTMFVTQIALMIIQPILPLHAQSLAGNDELLRTKVGLVFSMPGLAAVLAASRWGRWGDRIGYRTTLGIALIGAGVLYLPQGMAGTILQLALMRFCMGLCTAGIGPAAQAVVASTTDPNRTSGALSMLQSAQSIGNVAAPLMGGFLSAHVGIRPIFSITAVLLLGTGIAAFRVATQAPTPAAPDEVVARR